MDSVELLKLLDCFKELSEKVDRISALTNKRERPTQSESINELMAALAKAQSEFRIASEDSKNPHFKSKYAKLVDLVVATRPALSKHGLCVIQKLTPMAEAGQLLMYTILGHSSGQYIESVVRIIPAKNDPQTFGSHLTYLKRYAYASLIGCVSAFDRDDDDGEKAVETTRYKEERGTSLDLDYDSRNESFDTVTKEQLEELDIELNGYPHLLKQLLRWLGIEVLADMPKSKYMVSINKIREIKLKEDTARK